MRILITAASSRLSHELAGALAKSHEVVLTDRRQVSTQYSFARSDLATTNPPTSWYGAWTPSSTRARSLPATECQTSLTI